MSIILMLQLISSVRMSNGSRGLLRHLRFYLTTNQLINLYITTLYRANLFHITIKTPSKALAKKSTLIHTFEQVRKLLEVHGNQSGDSWFAPQHSSSHASVSSGGGSSSGSSSGSGKQASSSHSYKNSVPIEVGHDIGMLDRSGAWGGVVLS